MSKETYLAHHGVLGMKWGVRRYQNKNGSYTESGKKKYISDKTAGIKKDIDSFKGHENGVQAKNGKTVLSKEDVSGIIKGLEQQKEKQEQKLSDKWDSKTARIESSRKEGIDFANKLAADHKKGISAANALISAQKKAKETGSVDSKFLNNPNISQKAKNKVTRLAKQRTSKEVSSLDVTKTGKKAVEKFKIGHITYLRELYSYNKD